MVGITIFCYQIGINCMAVPQMKSIIVEGWQCMGWIDFQKFRLQLLTAGNVYWTVNNFALIRFIEEIIETKNQNSYIFPLEHHLRRLPTDTQHSIQAVESPFLWIESLDSTQMYTVSSWTFLFIYLFFFRQKFSIRSNPNKTKNWCGIILIHFI